MSDTPNGETTNQEPLSNNGSNASTQPSGNAVDPAEVERLRKEAEQARMRANQLENELAAKKAAEEEAQRQALEEQNEWKAIAEQEKAKREALENERLEAEAKQALETAQADLFKDFPSDVVELAQETGLTLQATTDEAINKLRSSLEKIQAKIANDAQVGPNNGNQSAKPQDRRELLQSYAISGRESDFNKALSDLHWIQAAKAVNGDK